MNQFRKKPVVIEAFQMTPERRADNRDWPSWLNEAWNRNWPEPGAVSGVSPGERTDRLQISTPEGVHLVSWGDWIIRGVKGELYPCKPDIFEMTYEPHLGEPARPVGFVASHSPSKPALTFEALKAVLNTLTPEQLAAPVVWSGDERGGYVKHAYIHREDWLGEPGDHETWLPGSEALKQPEDYADASVCIPAGTVHLLVD